MSTTTNTYRALQINSGGTVTEVAIPIGGEGLRAAIDCDRFDVLALDERIDLWIDDEGLLVAEPLLNLPATVLAHALGVPTAVFGTAVALSFNPVDGDPLGLTDAQTARVQLLLQRPDPAVTAAVTHTLSRLLKPRP